jgi:mannose-6-phosphate isomerase-like protein (cupin superfamily)
MSVAVSGAAMIGGGRFTWMSSSYALAVDIFGGFAPFISQCLIDSTGSRMAPTAYGMAAAQHRDDHRTARNRPPAVAVADRGANDEMTGPIPILLARAVAEELANEPGRLSALMLRHGSMELRWYAPKETDPQEPHDRDELYVVVAGRGWFTRDQERVPIRPGDALFVAAHQPHRFDNFTPDLAMWVILYGPSGGEAP